MCVCARFSARHAGHLIKRLRALPTTLPLSAHTSRLLRLSPLGVSAPPPLPAHGAAALSAAAFSNPQRAIFGLVACVLLLFLILLPLFILMRADDETGWPWAVVFIPVWIGDAVYGALVVMRVLAAIKQGSDTGSGGGHLHLTLRHSLLAAAVFLSFVAFQVLLVLRLSSDASSSPVTYTIALVPLYVAMLPTALSALWQILYHWAWRKLRPLPEMQPPTLSQLAPSLHALGGRLLVGASLALAGLHADGVVDFSWWFVLLPAWVALGLVTLQWYVALKSVLASSPGQGGDEERAAKLGALGMAAVVGVLLTICFLLLSLRIGGQTDYDAWIIASPIFFSLAFACCCCGCLACLARIAASAQRNHSNGHPPYDEVRDEEAGGGGGGGGGGEGGGGGGCSGGGGESSTTAASSSASSYGAASRESPTAAAAAVEEASGHPAAAAASASSASAAADRAASCGGGAAGLGIPHINLAGGGAGGPGAEEKAQSARGAASTSAAYSPALGSQTARDNTSGGGSVSVSRAAEAAKSARAAEAEGLSTKELKQRLGAMGVAHEHCLEKSELLALYLAQQPQR